jgi:hypothetical protein
MFIWRQCKHDGNTGWLPVPRDRSNLSMQRRRLQVSDSRQTCGGGRQLLTRSTCRRVNNFAVAIWRCRQGCGDQLRLGQLETTSGVCFVGVRRGPQGSPRRCRFRADRQFPFIGREFAITTTDGRKFDFEVELRYDAQLGGCGMETTNEQ